MKTLKLDLVIKTEESGNIIVILYDEYDYEPDEDDKILMGATIYKKIRRISNGNCTYDLVINDVIYRDYELKFAVYGGLL